MTAVLWRIGTDTRDYEAHDLGGRGAEVTGGRWNRPGLPVVYTAGSIALACLETLVHLNALSLPLNCYLVRIEIPRAIWAGRREATGRRAPAGWDAVPEGKASLDFGDAWLRARRSALLVVPSVIVPEETNVLINPRHPDAQAIEAKKIRRWAYDARIAGRGPGTHRRDWLVRD